MVLAAYPPPGQSEKVPVGTGLTTDRPGNSEYHDRHIAALKRSSRYESGYFVERDQPCLGKREDIRVSARAWRKTRSTLQSEQIGSIHHGRHDASVTKPDNWRYLITMYT